MLHKVADVSCVGKIIRLIGYTILDHLIRFLLGLLGQGIFLLLQILMQDIHQFIVIGVASIVPNQAYADSMMDEISKFLEEITDAEILDETREMR